MKDVCKWCGSADLELEEKFETINPETDELELTDGYLCVDCGTFYEKNGLYFEPNINNIDYTTTFLKPDP